jgi:hypothetical protein
VCGCTEFEPCEPPCGWAEVNLCTGCLEAAHALARWQEGSHRANMAALLRETRVVTAQ